ncbi:MAG: hypothetical protein NTW78_03890 [Campylobacterales bacterium]|nr:hypothetical protein [Campylobacterales bacterium]
MLNKKMRLWIEFTIIVIGLVFLWYMGAIGQIEKLISTAVTVAIAMVLGFIASKKLGANEINWEKVNEDTKVYFRMALILGAIFGYAIIANSFSVRLG